ncbi:hypothetical protein MNBD_NITROSPINAE02-188 [hydrothermal vent metagenome]|uniref:Methyltransferase domain-containing protein n=1 Tax=hydrothermal vent metagenome TaxID=652676 RepID=A0A3B1BPM2_9ZZZZ
MANFDSANYVDIQKQDWNIAASGWEKWDNWLDENMSELNSILTGYAGVAQGHKILDLGSGTGYPAIHAAREVGAGGDVVGLDLADRMLEVARKKSADEGVENITFKTCDIRKIPFDNESFNAITSRFCFMFLPHLSDTLSEALRALKPGGKIAGAVWASVDDNPAFTLPVGVIKEYADVPQPDPQAPGLFALAEPGKLKRAMENAGFSDVTEKEIGITWKYESGEIFVQSFKELAAPMKALFNSLPADQREEAESRIAQAAERYRADDGIEIPGMTLVVTGRK